MKKVRILLYKTPKFKWKYIVNWLISIRTWSWWSHIEIWTTGTDGDFAYPPQNPRTDWAYEKGFYGTCWTSTMRGEDNGTVKRPANEVLDHPENWDYIEIELEDHKYDNLITLMQIEVEGNEGYSKWDLLKFISPIHFPDNDRNICSEFVDYMLFQVDIFRKYGIVSPGKVAKKLIRLGCKVGSLK
jgi:hypothetical protein